MKLAQPIPKARAFIPGRKLKTSLVSGVLIAIAFVLYTQFNLRAEAGKEKYDYITGNVLSVLDGDSIRFQASHGDLTIELRGIDAPELGQKFGKHARHYLSELINSKKVTIAMKADDRDGILRGEIFLDGVSINKLLLKDGFAWARRGSSGNRSWISIEKQARDHRFGLWRQHDAMAPWEYRELVLEGVGATP